jgi:hypothetical protein
VGRGVDTAQIERGRLGRPRALRLLRLLLCLSLFTSLPLFVFGKLWCASHERDGHECDDERRSTDCCWEVFHVRSFPLRGAFDRPVLMSGKRSA